MKVKQHNSCSERNRK